MSRRCSGSAGSGCRSGLCNASLIVTHNAMVTSLPTTTTSPTSGLLAHFTSYFVPSSHGTIAEPDHGRQWPSVLLLALPTVKEADVNFSCAQRLTLKSLHRVALTQHRTHSGWFSGRKLGLKVFITIMRDGDFHQRYIEMFLEEYTQRQETKKTARLPSSILNLEICSSLCHSGNCLHPVILRVRYFWTTTDPAIEW
ncbi:uncharacterized protein EV420DRAFT_1481623 [Desarmillaria tabescens]|uniref:Uncharacterized protein n=1 Tax=Armillaria tabescens TaxID=1929756 RepID=A0AA39K4G4_ARMTA|nr:uncharacterized protein EV420DRAFT_1481623 [Desarmillaria tabescens]KAK0454182.1 hypothetical protein EV420DRAFT_1481623 [Desarmillaria tabescens]